MGGGGGGGVVYERVVTVSTLNSSDPSRKLVF